MYAIQFWAGRTFTALGECNRQAMEWRDQVAHQRHWSAGVAAPSIRCLPKSNRVYWLLMAGTSFPRLPLARNSLTTDLEGPAT
jgi:hypothetical protein